MSLTDHGNEKKYSYMIVSQIFSQMCCVQSGFTENENRIKLCLYCNALYIAL